MRKVTRAGSVFCMLVAAVISVSASAADRIIVGPPTATLDQGKQLYAPLVGLLSEVTGDNWVYEHASEWLSYTKLVVSDRADLTFSQAQFAGYLSLYHNHHILVRAPDDIEWLLVANKNSGDEFMLAGQTVCAIPPPELGSLVLTTLKEMEDPMRTPSMVTVTNEGESLSGINSGLCMYTVVRGDALSGADRSALRMRSLSTTPGPAITVSNRIGEQVADQIRNALLSDAGLAATRQLREHYGLSQFVASEGANSYLLASSMLVEGYLLPMQRMDKAFETVQSRAEEVASEGSEEWVATVDPMLVSDIRAVQQLAQHPIIREAVRAQNARKVTLDRIQAIDEAWSSTEELTPFKLSLQTSEVGTLLKQSVLLNPSYTELFVTDDQGANVAAYPATSDYWQGDEEKFTKSFVGRGRVFVGEQEYDESTKKVAVQVSVPVYDETNKATGVLVAGLVVDYLRWKEKQNIANIKQESEGSVTSVTQ